MYSKVKQILFNIWRSPITKNICTYLIFLVISGIAWLQIANRVDKIESYELEIKINHQPQKDFHWIDPLPRKISLDVNRNGLVVFDLLRMKLFPESKQVQIDFQQYDNHKGRFVVRQHELQRIIEATLGKDMSVVSFKPDSMSVRYTLNPGKRVPVSYDYSFELNHSYVVYGKMPHDSVMVYGSKSDLAKIQSVRTHPITGKNITENIKTDVFLCPIENVRIEPMHINVTIPVEPLVEYSKQVLVETRGVPAGKDLVVFPSVVTIKYRAPKSMRVQNVNASVQVYYDEHKTGSDKLKVNVINGDWSYSDITTDVDSVSYYLHDLNK